MTKTTMGTDPSFGYGPVVSYELFQQQRQEQLDRGRKRAERAYGNRHLAEAWRVWNAR